MEKINKNIPIPLYYQLKQIIIERIEKKIYVVGKTHLTEDELMKEFGVSRTTVRQAMSDLVNEGMIERRKGIGTVILEKNEEFGLIQAKNFIINDNEIIETKLISLEIEKPEYTVMKILNLTESDKVYNLKRIRSRREGPLSFSSSNIPVKYFPNLKRDLDNVVNGLYKYIDQSDYPLTTIEQLLETGFCDQTTASILGARDKTPIWILKNIAYSHSIPVEYGISTYLQNAGFRIKMTSERKDYKPYSNKTVYWK